MKANRSTTIARNGAVTSPHYLASQTGMKILQNGGNAMHAAVAIAATLGVVYPHMNGIGGDNFWLIYNAEERRLKGLNASGKAGHFASRETYRQLGYQRIPERGYLAANTVPGALSGWVEAYEYAEASTNQSMEWSDLLVDAIDYANNGFPVTNSQIKMAVQFLEEDRQEDDPFYQIYVKPLVDQIKHGDLFYQKDLANTLQQIAKDKGYSFYHGDLATKMVRASQMEQGLLTMEDFASHRADWVEPLSVEYRDCRAYNLPPNTQGIASLSILNILNQIDLSTIDDQEAAYYHIIVEATKLAFRDRDKWVTDPAFTNPPVKSLLSAEYGKELAGRISSEKSLLFEKNLDPRGDTVWFGVVDQWGNAVSMIQSIYHEYGAAVVPEDTGIILQNRGSFFSLDQHAINRLEPNKRTFHTLNPAMLFKNDKPYLVYGTMGGEGQPQTQAALVTRVIDYDYSVQAAIEAPRWLFGRTWGASSNSLKLENRITENIRKELFDSGHDIEVVEAYSDLMGHAGAIKINENNVKHAGSDPRSDGLALGY
ncbi:gamma-glutamyltransferase [Gracilibacillus salinarum]|uniref:Glutathione hydrolase proenzyme n=1 Tax=Gracilibacillus salinarum TaxID=2932255 RepID=A0ABY4GIJ2_9BACI|nr:gamma-glutamyltransferase [Gracilibacillus salinarum]UOQ84175.1 gamma-glutamyltransferase [Gracilibacillus salinarum]